MPCLTIWPIAEACGQYGTCVDSWDLSLAPGDVDHSSEHAYCQCDSSWMGDGDYVSNEGQYCLTNAIAIRAMWSVTTLVACYTVYKSWSTVIGFAVRQRAAMATAALQQAVLSNNGTQGGTLNTVGTGGGGGNGGGSGGVGSGDSERCGTCVPVMAKMWGSAPIRLAMLMCISSAALLALGVLKLARLDMTGFALGATFASATALLFVWASVYTAMVSLVHLQINIIKMHFSVTDKNRVRKQLHLFRNALIGVFMVLPTTGSFIQFVIYSYPQHQDVLAMVYCLSQVGNAFCTGMALWYVANNLIAILSGQATGTPSGTASAKSAAQSSGANTSTGKGAAGATVAVVVSPKDKPANAVELAAVAAAAANGTGTSSALFGKPAAATAMAAGTAAPSGGPSQSGGLASLRGGVPVAATGTVTPTVDLQPGSAPAFASGRVAPAPPTPLTIATTAAPGLQPPAPAASPAAAFLSPKAGSRPPSPRAISAQGGGPAVALPVKTPGGTGVSAERVEFATRMRDLKKQGVGIMRNQVIIYLAFGLFPLLRSCLTYQAPFSWAMAMAGQLFTLAALGDRRKSETPAAPAGSGAAARQALAAQQRAGGTKLGSTAGGTQLRMNTQMRNTYGLATITSPKAAESKQLIAVSGRGTAGGATANGAGGSGENGNGKYLVRVQPKPSASPRAASDDGNGPMSGGGGVGVGGGVGGATSGMVSGAASPRSPASPMASPPPQHRAPSLARPTSGALSGSSAAGSVLSPGSNSGLELVPMLSMPPPMMALPGVTGIGTAPPPPPPLARGSSGAVAAETTTNSQASQATVTVTSGGSSGVSGGAATSKGGVGASPALDSLLTITERVDAAASSPSTPNNATAAAAAASAAAAAEAAAGSAGGEPKRKESQGDVKLADVASD